MKLEQRLSALLLLHLHSGLNTWLQWNGHTQLHDKTRNISLWRFAAPYITYFTVFANGNYLVYICCFVCMCKCMWQSEILRCVLYIKTLRNFFFPYFVFVLCWNNMFIRIGSLQSFSWYDTEMNNYGYFLSTILCPNSGMCSVIKASISV